MFSLKPLSRVLAGLIIGTAASSASASTIGSSFDFDGLRNVGETRTDKVKEKFINWTWAFGLSGNVGRFTSSLMWVGGPSTVSGSLWTWTTSDQNGQRGTQLATFTTSGTGYITLSYRPSPNMPTGYYALYFTNPTWSGSSDVEFSGTFTSTPAIAPRLLSLPPPTPAMEPGVLLLLGLGSLVMVASMRRARRAA